jgi:hypothetical protein
MVTKMKYLTQETWSEEFLGGCSFGVSNPWLGNFIDFGLTVMGPPWMVVGCVRAGIYIFNQEAEKEGINRVLPLSSREFNQWPNDLPYALPIKGPIMLPQGPEHKHTGLW